MNVSVLRKNMETADAQIVKDIARVERIPEKLAELLYLRGIRSVEAAKRFLYPDPDFFHDPFLLKGMRETVERLEQAIERNEKIVVYGDYDADGVCAAAILSLYLSKRGLEVYVHIPNRVGDGYGLNIETLENILETHMPDLILTCDCGISCAVEVGYAIDLGVDVIVTDHHEVSGEIPPCVVVNPKQEDCTYPCNSLCGAGVALKVIEALGGRDEMMLYTDLACVATVADLVPLEDENRLIVQMGLKRIEERKNLGLKILFAELGLDKITSGDVAYKVAPRINAAGRMGDAYRAFELLTSTDPVRVHNLVDEINADNDRRKAVCDEMYAEAIVDLENEDLINNRAVILSHPSWEKGITGILAARLAGDYNRPAFVMVGSGDNYKGTCRSVEGINIYDLLVSCGDHLVEFGGHAQAAGFSILPEKIDDFRRAVNEYLSTYPSDCFTPKCSYDMDISLEEIDYNFVNSLDHLEPCGNGNPKPLFRLEADGFKVAPCKSNRSHVAMTFGSGFQIFAYNYSRLSYQLLSSGIKTLIIELQISNYGDKKVKGTMRCCAPSSLYIADDVCEGYEYGLMKYLPKKDCRYSLYKAEELATLVGGLYGTLVVAFDRKTYEEYAAKYDRPTLREFAYATAKNNFSRVVVAPNFECGDYALSNYERIVFLRAPLNGGIISYLNSVTRAEILLPEPVKDAYEVSVDREIFAEYFSAIRAEQDSVFGSVAGMFRHLKQMRPQFNYRQFVFCVRVFEELGILSESDSPFSLSVIKGVKADLTASAIYNLVKERSECAK